MLSTENHQVAPASSPARRYSPSSTPPHLRALHASVEYISKGYRWEPATGSPVPDESQGRKQATQATLTSAISKGMFVAGDRNKTQPPLDGPTSNRCNQPARRSKRGAVSDADPSSPETQQFAIATTGSRLPSALMEGAGGVAGGGVARAGESRKEPAGAVRNRCRSPAFCSQGGCRVPVRVPDKPKQVPVISIILKGRLRVVLGLFYT